jgi:hypothetical protein
MSDENTAKVPPPADPYAVGTVHEYAAIRAPNLRTRVVVGGKDVETQFVRGVAKVDGPVAQEFDRCINEQIGGLYQLVRKLDREAAIRLAKEHAASAGRGAAVKGGFHSGAIQQLRNEARAASGQSLAEAAPNNPEELAKFADDLAHNDLLITEIKQSVVSDVPPEATHPSPVFRSPLKLR